MNILIKNEQGEIIDQLKDKLTINLIQSFTSFILSESEADIKFLEKLPMINHIDPYADTYINSTQAEMFVEEFKKLSEYTKDKNLKQYCRIVISELENLDRCDFLVFSGD